MFPFRRGGAAVLTGRRALQPGMWFPAHTHEDAHQLVWATSGVLSVRCGTATWVLPPGIALWLPAGLEHETGAGRATDMAGVYIDPDRCPIDWTQPTVVAVDALQRELLLLLRRDDLLPDARTRAEAVLFDVLHPVPVAHVDVPALHDPRAAEVAEALTADPADARSLEAWGRSVGASGRTLARLWLTDAGMTFRDWRTRLRVRHALPMLAAGEPVYSVAHRVGYATPSAFVAAFRREVGATPGHYLSRW